MCKVNNSLLWWEISLVSTPTRRWCLRFKDKIFCHLTNRCKCQCLWFSHLSNQMSNQSTARTLWISSFKISSWMLVSSRKSRWSALTSSVMWQTWLLQSFLQRLREWSSTCHLVIWTIAFQLLRLCKSRFDQLFSCWLILEIWLLNKLSISRSPRVCKLNLSRPKHLTESD